MAATAGYQAGLETNQTVMSYVQETTWAVNPGSTGWQNIRYTGETLSGSKTRSRPAEIQATGEVVQTVTTQEMASGAINFALSYGTFDDFFGGALNANWTTNNVAGVAGDITLTAGTPNVLNSPTVNKFANVIVGQWIRTLGFTNAGNNGFFRVVGKPNNQALNLSANIGGSGAVVTETPTGVNAKVRASSILNSTVFKSFYMQQAYNSTTFLQYPGSFCTGFTLTGGTGQFMTGSFNFMSQQELNAITDGAAGTALPAPTGRVHDCAASFGAGGATGQFLGFLINETAQTYAMDSFTVTVTATGAAAEYAMGTAVSQGQVMGLVEVKGTVKLYFKDFTAYTRFKSEAQGALEFITKDPAGNAYILTILNGALMNPKVDVGGPSKPVYVTFDIEGNPQTTGGTIQIDRLPSV